MRKKICLLLRNKVIERLSYLNVLKLTPSALQICNIALCSNILEQNCSRAELHRNKLAKLGFNVIGNIWHIKTQICLLMPPPCVYLVLRNIKNNKTGEFQKKKQGPQNHRSSAKNYLKSLKILNPPSIPAIFTPLKIINSFFIKLYVAKP